MAKRMKMITRRMPLYRTVSSAFGRIVMPFGIKVLSVRAVTMNHDGRQRGHIELGRMSYLTGEGRKMAEAMLQACDIADEMERRIHEKTKS